MTCTTARNDAPAHRRGRRAAVVALWACAIAACLWWQSTYQTLAGAAGASPATWPSSRELPQPDGRTATIVLALHPRCPCSVASVAELARVCAGLAIEHRVVVLVTIPKGAGQSWRNTATCAAAGRIPGALLVADEDGRLAADLGFATSGHIAAYSRVGQLVFSGGVTGSRGQRGENDGAEALAAALGAKPAARIGSARVSSVYGCETVRLARVAGVDP